LWTFEQPGYFFLLLVLPVLAWFKYQWKGRGGRLAFPLGQWGGLRFQPSIPGMRLVMMVSNLTFWLAFVLMITALAGPGLTKQEKIYLNTGADILIVLDESPSMAARDFPPENRFNAAKGVIKRFVEGRENDQIGLVTFGRDAALRVPLTLDYPYLLERLSTLQVMDLGDGTALGLGLAFAASHLGSSTAPQKAVIVLTDGVNNAGEIQPSTAAELLRSMGVPLYLIGIGTNSAVPLELTNPRTGIAYSGVLEGGFQEDFLKSLAVPPLGAYFSAGSAGSLESIFLAIDSRETASKRVKLQVWTKPLHGELMLAAFVALLGFFLIRKLLLKEIL